MSHGKNLAREIAQTRKKITEGVETYDELYETLRKVAGSNPTQKEKLEQDLKTQIKKLQRMRDDVKKWASGSDVKDKAPLLEDRRTIEARMESFKALEKEIKTKAFSKEGLILATKLDPAEQAKAEARQILEGYVDSLSRQIEQAEAEIELLQANAGSGKKKTKSGGGAHGERERELERQNERAAWHVEKLEAVMRMLENGKVTPDQVTELKEDVSYFVESNQEEDFEEDEGIYDELNLEEDEEPGSLPAHSEEPEGGESDLLSASEDYVRTPAKTSESVTAPSNPTSPTIAKKTPVRKTTADAKAQSTITTTASEKHAERPPAATPSKASSSTSSVPSAPAPVTPATAAATTTSTSTPAPSSAPQPTRQPSLPPIKYAAAAAAAVASSPSAATASVTSPTAQPANVPAPAAAASSSSAPPPGFAPQQQSEPVVAARQQQPPSSQQAPVTTSPSASSAQLQPPNGHVAAMGGAPPGISPSVSPSMSTQLPSFQAVGQQMQASGQPTTNGSSGRSPQTAPQATRAASNSAESSGSQVHTPNALSDLMTQFEGAKQRSAQRLGDLDGLHSALETGLTSAPQPSDAERPRYYHPRNPCQTPPYYPQQPHPALDDKTLYSRLDLDTLFFMFYYKTNTYEQWCAARELKRQSWRFHKQYLTWFQRLSQPQAITDEYEQGMYIYFDWENTWCQRKKSDFRFEYRWLSED